MTLLDALQQAARWPTLGRCVSRHSSMAAANSSAIGWSALRPRRRYSSSSGAPDQKARSKAARLAPDAAEAERLVEDHGPGPDRREHEEQEHALHDRVGLGDQRPQAQADKLVAGQTQRGDDVFFHRAILFESHDRQAARAFIK